MFTLSWVAQKCSDVLSAGSLYHGTGTVMHGIFLKALRDTASVTLMGDRAIVALSGNSRINVA